MPPNLLVKAAFVRGELENVQKTGCEGKNTIRTDFVLQNIFSYSLRKTYPFNAVCAKNEKECYVLKQLEQVYDVFQSNFGENIKGLCTDIEVTEDTIGSILLGVSNELFCEGITWSRIIALISFVGELTLQCVTKKLPDRFVDVIYECFCRLVKEKLMSWIDDHGGWEGVTALSVSQQGNANSLEAAKSSDSGWAKSFLHTTVQVLGTLAHIANSSSNALP